MRILPEKNFSTLDVIGKPLDAVRRGAQEKPARNFPRSKPGLPVVPCFRPTK